MTHAAELGYGNKWIRFDPYHSPTVKLLQKNLYFFAAGKSIAQIKEMNNLLVDDSGKIRNWQDFRNEVLKLNKKYNLKYLQAEYQTAKASAQSARKWNEAQEVKDLYPNLEYRTVQDNQVREEHAKLHGIIRPIDDPFWDIHYPPNGWRCRCTTRSSDKEPTPKDKIPKVPIHKHFRHNVGKIGQIFDEKQHPYFKYTKEYKCSGNEPQALAVKKCLRIFLEKAKLKFPLYKVRYTADNGAKVYVSRFAIDANDYEKNLKIAKLMADNGYTIKIPPYVNITNYKNPDFYIDHFVDAYINDYSDVRRYIKSAFNEKYGKKGQLRIFKESSIIIKLKKQDIKDGVSKLNGEFKYWSKNKYVYIIIDKVVVKVSRKDNYNKMISKILKAIE